MDAIALRRHVSWSAVWTASMLIVSTLVGIMYAEYYVLAPLSAAAFSLLVMFLGAFDCDEESRKSGERTYVNGAYFFLKVSFTCSLLCILSNLA